MEGYLEKLEGTDYPYVFCAISAWRRPGQLQHAQRIRENCRAWNERYAFPKLIPSLNRNVLPRTEKQLAADLPVFRGELPATDYSAASNCTAYPSSITVLRTTSF